MWPPRKGRESAPKGSIKSKGAAYLANPDRGPPRKGRTPKPDMYWVFNGAADGRKKSLSVFFEKTLLGY
jgi:hypothetical protein